MYRLAWQMNKITPNNERKNGNAKEKIKKMKRETSTHNKHIRSHFKRIQCAEYVYTRLPHCEDSPVCYLILILQFWLPFFCSRLLQTFHLFLMRTLSEVFFPSSSSSIPPPTSLDHLFSRVPSFHRMYFLLFTSRTSNRSHFHFASLIKMKIGFRDDIKNLFQSGGGVCVCVCYFGIVCSSVASWKCHIAVDVCILCCNCYTMAWLIADNSFFLLFYPPQYSFAFLRSTESGMLQTSHAMEITKIEDIKRELSCFGSVRSFAFRAPNTIPLLTV